VCPGSGSLVAPFPSSGPSNTAWAPQQRDVGGGSQQGGEGEAVALLQVGASGLVAAGSRVEGTGSGTCMILILCGIRPDGTDDKQLE